MSWTLDPITLRVFIAVCEEGTIVRAAARELMAASAISKRIADMEALVGAALLHRGQRGVQPTAAGQALLAQGRVILRGLDKLKAELGEYGSGVRGHVRVLANLSSIVEFLPESLTAFLSAHPQIRLDLEERPSAEIVRGIADGVAEIGICRDSALLDELHAVTLARDHFAIVVHASHALASRKRIAFADTLVHDHLSLSLNTALAPLMQSAAAQAGRELRFRVQVSSFDAAFRMIQSGLAIAVLPREAIGPHGQLYGLRAIPLTDAWAMRQLVLCVRDPQALSPAAQLLHAHLVQGAPR